MKNAILQVTFFLNGPMVNLLSCYVILRKSDLLLHKSMDWFLYDNGLRYERVNFNKSYKS